jgi:hypothetical protein
VQLTGPFVRITDPKVRRGLVSLVKSMTEDDSE